MVYCLRQPKVCSAAVQSFEWEHPARFHRGISSGSFFHTFGRNEIKIRTNGFWIILIYVALQQVPYYHDIIYDYY